MTAAVSRFAAVRPFMWAGFALLLVAPLIAMRLTDDVRWDAADFLAATLLLGGLGASIEIIARTVSRPRLRPVLMATVIGIALSIWAVAAVGLFD